MCIQLTMQILFNFFLNAYVNVSSYTLGKSSFDTCSYALYFSILLCSFFISFPIYAFLLKPLPVCSLIPLIYYYVCIHLLFLLLRSRFHTHYYCHFHYCYYLVHCNNLYLRTLLGTHLRKLFRMYCAPCT